MPRSPFLRSLIAITTLTIAFTLVACDKEKEAEGEQLALKISAQKEEAVREAAPPPATEEAVLDALTAALTSRDIKAVKQLVAPELKADLDRMHRADPERLWRESSRFADSLKSGFRIAHRDESTSRVWRVLVRFGNGKEERIDFTRVDNRMLILAF